MDLATHQRKLLGLFRSTYQVCDEDGAYLKRVAESKDIEEGRRNIFLWRLWVLERTSALTFRLLRRRGLLEEAVNRFISGQNISPFRETQAPAFLEAMSGHGDALVAAVAGFELALSRVRDGDGGTYTIAWPVEPVAVLHSLAQDRELPDDLLRGDFEVVVSRDLPGLFAVRASVLQPIMTNCPIPADCAGRFAPGSGVTFRAM
jgi:hypothetical protein